MSAARIRGAAIKVGDVVIVDGRRVEVAAVRRAVHRPDVVRVLTDTAGRETTVNVRNLYARPS
jgi:hypothetical protein